MSSVPTLDQVRQALQRLQASSSNNNIVTEGNLNAPLLPSSATTASSASADPRADPRNEALKELVVLLRPILCGREEKEGNEADARALELIDAVASEVVATASSPQVLEAFVNVLWQLSLFVNTSTMPSETNEAASSATTSATTKGESSSSSMFVTFLQLLREHATAPKAKKKTKGGREKEQELAKLLATVLIGSLPANLLEESGWIGSDADLAKRLRLFNTSHYYKQHRFHLMSEESQGYAKLLAVMVRLSTVGGDASNSSAIEGIRNIAGTFSLDPNRCVDIALNVMAWNLSNSTAAAEASASATTEWTRVRSALDPFLPMFRPTPNMPPLLLTAHLPALLAFSMSYKGESGTKAAATANSPVELSALQEHRERMLQIMVWLVHHELLDVPTMLEYLPETVDVAEAYHKLHHAHAESIRQQGRVRLAAPATSGQGPAAPSPDDSAVLAAELARQLANEGLVRWIQTFVSLNRFDLIRRSFDESFWRHLCYLFPADLAVPILGQTLEPILDSASTSSMLMLPPWKSPAEIMESAQIRDAMQVDDPDGDATLNMTTIRDVLDLVFESGCLRHVPVLYARLCRYVTAAIDKFAATSQHEDAMDVVVDIIGCLLPSSSLFDQNPNMSHAAWTMIEKLPYSTRYGLYQEWREEGRPLWLVEGEARALKAARYVLKRLSHDTIRDQSRALAKICHSYPLVVFTTILGQIESYDNLVMVMVEALRFVTPLSLDVLAFCILSRLGEKQPQGGGVNRSRLKEDGVNLSQWLQSLESFVGAFYKRFPQVDCTGLLSYMQHRLKDGHVMEIGLLRTLLKTSAGWAFCDYSPAASLSSSQLEGLSGSALLRRETMTFGVVEAMNPRSSERLRQVLQNQDAGVTLLILLAQARHTIIFGGAKGGDSTKSKPVKLVAHLVDSCQVLMAVLLDFLTDPAESRSSSKTTSDGYNAASPRMHALEVYAASLPTLQDLFCRYKVDYASSWMMCRPLIRASTWKQLEADAANDSTSNPVDPSKVSLSANWMDAFMTEEESHKLYKEMLPAAAWCHITTDLFGTFFTYALFDVMCPEDTYSTEIARLEKQAERLAQVKPASSVSQSTQLGAAAPKSDEEELNRVRKVTSRLINDQKKQRTHVAAVRKRIASKKASFFVSDAVTKEGALEFLSHCVYKRCMQGPDEALYCAAFISMLHEEGTPGFGTLHLIDSLIVALTRSLFGITEGEAANVSILLHEVWKLVSRWRYDEAAFEAEVTGRPGSFMEPPEGAADPAPINHNDFCGLYNKWHAVIGAAAIGCLESLQYIHIRNCLIVLTRLVETYPTRPGLANKLVETLEPLQDESNAFADIRASAQAYSKQLLRARDDGVWKEESAAAVRARKEREESVAAARQQQAKLLMAEISREAEQISERIGESDMRGRGGDRRRMDAPASAPPPSSRSGRPSAGALSTSPPPPQPNPPSGREGPRDDRRPTHQRLSDPSPASASGSYTAILSGPGSGLRDEASTRSSLEGRWRERDRVGGDRLASRDRGGGDSREKESSKERGSGNDRKRSRPSSPAEDGEATAEESRSQKRARPDDADAEETSGGRRRKTGGRFRRS